MRIERHDIDREAARARFERTVTALDGFIASAPRTPDNLTILASNALDIVACGSVTAPSSPQIQRALRIASRSLAGLFTVACENTLPVEVSVIEGETIHYDRRPDDSIVHPVRWLQGFFVSALYRDHDGIQQLYETPMELLRASSTRSAEYNSLFVEAICGYLEGDPGTAKLLLSAMKATDPARPDVRMPDWTLHIDVPKIELFFHFATGDEAAFNAALQKAVELHCKYWATISTNNPDRNPDSFIALAPLALAALAHDRGMAFDVESDYLPAALLRG